MDDPPPFYFWNGPCPACGRAIDIETEVAADLLCPVCDFPIFVLL